MSDSPPVTLLLVQLGTPDAPETAAVRRYLAEFLADPRVVDLPRWKWLPILHGLVLRRRPPRVAELYRRIWGADGVAPLLRHTRRLAEALQSRLGPEVEVGFAMRYGNPSLTRRMAELAATRERLVVFPLYPQFAASTTASILDVVYRALARGRRQPALRVVPPFYDHPGYIQPLAATARRATAADGAGEPDHWLFSFHGLPQRHVDLGDPYETHCRATAAALAGALGLPEGRWSLAFQSRFGKEPWLLPATYDVLEALPRRGVKSLAMLCPGFVADCLETLEEIGHGGRERFLAAGGERFTLVPCLNDDPAWLDGAERLARRELAGWMEGD
ncbi:MAG: ferrochelatase [Magnetococcales bacterium]|nr:ferrochelatase [Magnetococcales bacterium]